MHDAYAAEIAPRAAQLYGQDWSAMPMISRQIVIDTVRGTRRGHQSENPLEAACSQAVAEWYAAREAPTVEVPPVEGAPEEVPIINFEEKE